MVLVSYSGREINAKLVYYGPGLSGKTTNLEYIYGSIPQGQRGKMVSMKTKTERTLFFDFLPIHLGELSGFKTRFLLYTVPGQVYYNATRKLVLKGVDAVVFVADSKRGKMDENVESLENLRENLREHGLNLDQVPWVLQYNKRDLNDVYSVQELDGVLNAARVPSFEAVATTGQGVVETFKGVSRLLLKKLAREIGVSVVGSETAPQTATASAPPPQVVPAPADDWSRAIDQPQWDGSVRFTGPPREAEPAPITYHRFEPETAPAPPARPAPEPPSILEESYGERGRSEPPPPIPFPVRAETMRREPPREETPERSFWPERPAFDEPPGPEMSAATAPRMDAPATPRVETPASAPAFPTEETPKAAPAAPTMGTTEGAPITLPSPAEPIDTQNWMRDLATPVAEAQPDRQLSVGERLRRWLSRSQEKDDAVLSEPTAKPAPEPETTRWDEAEQPAATTRESSTFAWEEDAELTPDLSTRSGPTSGFSPDPAAGRPDEPVTTEFPLHERPEPEPLPIEEEVAESGWNLPRQGADIEAMAQSSLPPAQTWGPPESETSWPETPCFEQPDVPPASGFEEFPFEPSQESVRDTETADAPPEHRKETTRETIEPTPETTAAAASTRPRFPSSYNQQRPREVIVPIEIYPEDLENGITFKLAFQAPWWQAQEGDEEMRGAA